MGYRDELQAARARIAALESDLDAERRRANQLQAALDGRTAPAAEPAEAALVPVVAPTSLEPHRRRVHYHPPATYVPVLRTWIAAAKTAYERSPTPGAGLEPTDSVVGWALGKLRAPLVYGLWLPIYWLSFCAVYPLAMVFALTVTPLLLPIILASRLSFSGTPPTGESGWYNGQASDDDGAGLLFGFAILMVPFTLPFVIALVVDE